MTIVSGSVLVFAILLSWLLMFAWSRTYSRVLEFLASARERELRADAAPPIPEPLPRVSVLLAARDEERRLGACLDSLRAQTYAALEIIVVDDRSSDGTRQIAELHARSDPRIKVVVVDEPEPGWFGKTNALRAAACEATGSLLLTTDADTIHAPESIRTGVAFLLAEQLDALSLVPRLEYETLTAHLLYPQIHAFLAALHFAHLRAQKGAKPKVPLGAVGAWFLVRREAWDAVGGMEAVHDQPAEDLALAMAIDGVGLKYRFAAAPSLWSTPAYGTLSEMYRGYARNPAFTLGGNLPRAIAFLIGTWVAALLPIMTAIWSAVALMAGAPFPLHPVFLAAGLVPYVVVLIMQSALRTKLRTLAWMSMIAPIGAILGSLLLFGLFLRAKNKKALMWKGRRYEERINER